MSTQKQLVNLRLDVSLLNGVKSLGGTRTEHITKALQLYLQPATQNRYSADMVSLLEREVEDLRMDKKSLQLRVDYLMLPWYKKMFLPIHR